MDRVRGAVRRIALPLALAMLTAGALSLVTAPAQAATVVSCGRPVDQGVGPAGQELVHVTATPSHNCGVQVDPASGTVVVNPSFTYVGVEVRSMVAGTNGLVPWSFQVDGDDGTSHPLMTFHGALRAAVEDVTGEEDLPATLTPGPEGVRVAAGGESVVVPWPRGPDGQLLMDHRRVYAPTVLSVSSDRLWEKTWALLHSTLGGATGDAVPWAGLRDDSMLPHVLVQVGMEEVEIGGLSTPLDVQDPFDAVPAEPSLGHRPGPDPLVGDPGRDGTRDLGVQADGAVPGSPVPMPVDRPVLVAVALAALLSLFGAVTLYRRLRESKVLEHPLRSEVYRTIIDRPGITAQGLADTLEVDYSTARHHVSVLTDFDFVHSRRDGRTTHYFENHGTYGAFEKRAIPLLRGGTSSEVARVVREHPGIRPAAVARRLGVDRSTVKWHVDRLRDADLVDTRPIDGRSFGLIVPDAARDVVDRWV